MITIESDGKRDIAELAYGKHIIRIESRWSSETGRCHFNVFTIAVSDLGVRGERLQVGGPNEAYDEREAIRLGIEIGRSAIDAD